jgi:endonuclease YncB( thermonuclease family)
VYEYKVTPLRVLDGDTAEFSISLGLNVHKTEILRFYGVNAPETTSSDPVERQRGIDAKDFVTKILIGVPETAVVAVVGGAPLTTRTPIAIEVRVQTAKPYSTDKYGRWLGTVLYRTATSDPANPWTNLNESLVLLGLAAPYFGGAR